MANELSLLTAQERLAVSRQALVDQLHGKRAPVQGQHAGTTPGDRWLNRFEWPALLRNIGRRWWQRHPANAVSQVALPLLDRYTKQRPFKAIGVAAATGALIVFVRPWRLLSVTAAAAAILKTSDVADMVTTLMQANRRSPDD